MSFVNRIKNIFGFGEFEDDYDMPETDVERPEMKAVPIEALDGPITASPVMVHQIFDKVVEITNAAVPAYLASALNPDRQKQYLYDALDASVKQYISSLEAAANDKCMAQWQKERDDLKKETDALKQRARELETKRTEMKEQNLSAERQKRALTERLRDLEAKVMQLEAEKEQLELENHGLINKVKVANVHENDVEELRKQLQSLQQEKGISAQAHAEPSEANAELQSKNAELQSKNTELQSKNTELESEKRALNQTISELTHRVEDITSQLETSKAEIAKLGKACEAAKVKDEMGGAMLNELQKRNAEAVNSAQESTKKIEELLKELEIKDAKISDLNNEIAQKEARIQADEEELDSIQEIVEQMDQFEKIKTSLEAKVRSLKETVNNAQRDNELLRSTIQNNLYAHAQQEKALLEQIEKLQKAQI